ncbi:hypothetical protein EVAR_25164_1 [Eumeta japonica]|uniref:Uncharacterized protein n=1 Tax=Eumeta variegata TaxID=151549 RepID=A0A4C1VQC6_EUMVA|nr:hypothetical protein EVAR_25164_1 [Eumeta japonica]
MNSDITPKWMAPDAGRPRSPPLVTPLPKNNVDRRKLLQEQNIVSCPRYSAFFTPPYTLPSGHDNPARAEEFYGISFNRQKITRCIEQSAETSLALDWRCGYWPVCYRLKSLDFKSSTLTESSTVTGLEIATDRWCQRQGLAISS